MISGLTGKTYEKNLNELNLLSHVERCEQADIIQTFKINHGLVMSTLQYGLERLTTTE